MKKERMKKMTMWRRRKRKRMNQKRARVH